MKYLSLALFILTLLIENASAQDTVAMGEISLEPAYFVSIISGVLLAYGFQFLLTALSVAAGVTAIGNLKEAYILKKYDWSEELDDDEKDDGDSGFLSHLTNGVQITSAIGLWNVITVVIALFGATALALMLVPTANASAKITLALVIWASFFMSLFYIETRVVGTLIGVLISTAISGLKASGDAIKSLLTPSPQTQTQNMIDHTIEKVRREISSEFDSSVITQAIEQFASRLDRKVPDYESLKKDIQEIVESAPTMEIESGQNANRSGSLRSKTAKWMAIQTVITAALKTEPGQKLTETAKEKMLQLQSLLSEMKSSYQDGDTTKESVENALANVSLDQEKVGDYIDRIQTLLQNITPDKIDRESLQKEMDEIIDSSAATLHGLKESIEAIDRDTLIETLEKNTRLDKNEIEYYISQIQAVFEEIKSRLRRLGDIDTESLLRSFEQKVADFLNSEEEGEYNYEALKYQVQKALNNPSESLAVIKKRISGFDRDKITELITRTGLINQRDINKVVESIEYAKNEVAKQVAEIEATAKRKLDSMKRQAVVQAEGIRKTAMSAAWWLVTAIVISAGAAMAGAWVAV